MRDLTDLPDGYLTPEALDALEQSPHGPVIAAMIREIRETRAAACQMPDAPDHLMRARLRAAGYEGYCEGRPEEWWTRCVRIGGLHAAIAHLDALETEIQRACVFLKGEGYTVYAPGDFPVRRKVKP